MRYINLVIIRVVIINISEIIHPSPDYARKITVAVAKKHAVSYPHME